MAELVAFLVSLSHYPVGDDPGYNTSILRAILDQGKLRAEVPFFPQLHQVYGGGRYVTMFILVFIVRLFHIQNIFLVPTYFAIFCMASSLIFIFLITYTWLNSRLAALFSILLLAFNHWFQANFWEGSYEQYTGLLFLTILIYFLLLWTKKKNHWLLLFSLILLGLLYKTHQLGFLVGAAIFMTTFFFYFRTALRPKYIILVSFLSLSVIGLLFYLIQPGYFAPNNVVYPLPKMLSQSEGIPYLLLIMFAISAAIMLFQKKNIVIFSWLVTAFIFSQSMLLGVPFYAFRFNVYFVVALAVISGVIVIYLRQGLNNLGRRMNLSLIISLTALFLIIFCYEFSYIHGLASWLTNQKKNPFSVILAEDVKAFKWLGDNSAENSVAAAPFKWGYYLPALSGRKVVLNDAVGGDSRDVRFPLAAKAQMIFASHSSTEARNLALDLGVTYIVWDASITRFPNSYAYDKNKFADSNYFEKVYDKETVTIYKVK